jgi:hypothetical protein
MGGWSNLNLPDGVGIANRGSFVASVTEGGIDERFVRRRFPGEVFFSNDFYRRLAQLIAEGRAVRLNRNLNRLDMNST